MIGKLPAIAEDIVGLESWSHAHYGHMESYQSAVGQLHRMETTCPEHCGPEWLAGSEQLTKQRIIIFSAPTYSRHKWWYSLQWPVRPRVQSVSS